MNRAAPLMLAATLCAAALPSQAQNVHCTMTELCPKTGLCVATPVTLAFNIDPNQFVDPVSKNEPPRNKVTWVSLHNERFQAEPIRMDNGIVGFWADIDGTSHLMTVQADGSSHYSKSDNSTRLSGYCEVTS